MLKLDCYLGPSIDVGPTVTAKIVNENGQVLHRSMYQPLIPDGPLDKDRSDAQEQFMASTCDRMGSGVNPREMIA